MEHRIIGPVALVFTAAVTAVVAAVQAYGSNDMTLKITWTLSLTTNPNMTQVNAGCRGINTFEVNYNGNEQET
jgi:ABC-type sugar transport system substrate-binding protein